MDATSLNYNPLIILGKHHDITTFRQSTPIKMYMEHVSVELAREYIPYIPLSNKNLIDILPELDKIGNPILEEFEIGGKKYNISPTTIRYLGFVGMMEEYLLHSKKIVEIGGGYGSQAGIILKIFPNIESYQLLDLEEMKILQKDYLQVFLSKKLNDKLNFTNHIGDYDLVIANYSLAELPKNIVDSYIPYLQHSNYGFIIWNTTNPIPEEIKLMKNYKEIINEPDAKESCWKTIRRLTYNQERVKEKFTFSFGSYDRIVNLGYNCYVAEVLKKLKIRDIAYPFDWITTNLSFISECVKNPGTFPFTSPDHIKFVKLGDNHYYYLNSDKTVLSLHDFASVDKYAPINQETYDKYQRRVNRFKKIFNSQETILFIRLAKFPVNSNGETGLIPEQDTPAKINKLADLITNLYPLLNFHILFCCDRGDVIEGIPKHDKVTVRVRYHCEPLDKHLYEILTPIKQEYKQEYKQDKVSVVIPTYNRGIELKNAVESVINNTYKDIEIIVVDDCSKDQTILDELKQQGIRIYKTEKNSGNPAIPRNIGIEKSSGEWICFLDDDDMFLPNKIKDQLREMKLNKSLFSCSDAIYSKTINYYDPRKKYDLYHTGMYVEEMKKILGSTIFPNKLTKKEILDHNWIITSGVIIHRSLISKVGKFVPAKETKEGWEDYNYWLRVLDYDNILMINTPLIFYNMTPRVEKKWHEK